MNPRVVIAGTKSGVGKTTITIGLMAAFVEQGYNVQPYKVGPDYIDPGFHTIVTDNQSRNLDSYFLSEEGVRESFLNSAQEADISIVEGVMGLFDGKQGRKKQGSTAQIAKMLKAPVVLVLDVKKMAQSAAAMAYGYKNFDCDLNLAGVILNNVGSERHYEMIKGPIEEEVGVKVLGYLPSQQELELPERHLGLVPTAESEELTEYITQLTALITEYLDLEAVVELAKTSAELELAEQKIFVETDEYDLTLGVAYDQAFNFYYQDNLDILENLGVKLEYFSPINDQKLPEVDGLYIGGGFPESFLEKLAANQSMKEKIYQQVEAGLPIYAECGGLMYLTEQIINFAQESFPMVGLIPAQVEMQDRLQAMGYVKAKACQDNLLLKAGEEVKGHEFHYSKLINLVDELDYSYQLFGGKGEDGRLEGLVMDNLLASYLHLHFGSNLQVARRFLDNCQAYKEVN
ncbi:hydrogenobyrinic acid a,c-diamide synthase (glutamine-hydrolyzing) [Natroniella acetigena]|uniref:cobyrinate a,c-diamide synthase n=1 Tax=Natroniella acetigena TaxID=52004 RepID=UPI00200B4185|nr:cobyrinate a,c-diamide synthase [Natroniella acetigena]MCK8826481.1 hydrogenobyrinic acid a,c-diamide synthase (glutamine-hydrolyzing) [Natroniella acetigena]